MMSNEKIINKVKNLLNKTVESGATQDEAISALTLARKLMIKYKLSQKDINSNKIEIVTCKLNCNTSISWVKLLVDIICKNFGVKYYVSGYKKNYYPILFGEKQDVEFTSNIINYAYEIANKLSTKYGISYRKKYGSSKGIKNAWLIGFLKGLQDKYEEQNKEKCYSLITTININVINAFNNHINNNEYKTTVSKVSMSYKDDSDAITDGYNNGKNFGFKQLS